VTRTSTAPQQWEEQLWEAVSTGDEEAATRTVFGALEDGASPETVLLDLVGAVQHRVGQEWAANRITVAQEHAATAINERAIAALSYRCAQHTAAGRGRATVACVDGEWHGLPARLVAEVLKLRGWQVDYLGAQVPTSHLISHIHQTGPEFVALSSSIPVRLPTAHATITAIQATGTPVWSAAQPSAGTASTPADWAPTRGRPTPGPPPTGSSRVRFPAPQRRTSPSTTCRTWPTRSTRWSPAPAPAWCEQ
jgi:Predicted cobalamin binding protein